MYQGAKTYTTDPCTNVNFNLLGGDSLSWISWNPSSIIIWRVLRPSHRLCHLHKLLVQWVLHNRHPLHLMRKAVQWDRHSIILIAQRRVIKVVRRYHKEDHLCHNRHNSLHLSNRVIHLIRSRCHLIWVHRYDKFENYVFFSRSYICFFFYDICLEC